MFIQMKRMAAVMAACLIAATLTAQSGKGLEERRLKPGNELAMKLYKEALKIAKKEPSHSLAMIESLAKDGYAPAQFKLYDMGKGDEWLLKAGVGGVYFAAEKVMPMIYTACQKHVNHYKEVIDRAKKGEVITNEEMKELEEEEKIFHSEAPGYMLDIKNYMDDARAYDDKYFFPEGYNKKRIEEALLEFSVRWNYYFDEYRKMAFELMDYSSELRKLQKK